MTGITARANYRNSPSRCRQNSQPWNALEGIDRGPTKSPDLLCQHPGNGIAECWILFQELSDAHLISTLLLVTTLPHIIIPWSRRLKSESSRGARGWVATVAISAVVGTFLVLGLAFAYSGNKYRNQFPADYNYPFGKDRPFAPSLAHTATNGAYDSRSLAGSETCGSSGCHTQIYNEWKTSAHRYAAMDPIFQGIQNVMAKQNGPESTRYCGGATREKRWNAASAICRW
jgi:hypothetical protein